MEIQQDPFGETADDPEKISMKVDAMGLLHNAAMQLKRRDGSTAFALLELANHLRLLMRGEASVEDWNRCYVGADGEEFDIESLVP